MTDPKIPLSKDPVLDNPDGIDPADVRKSNITIENPENPVNISGYTVIDGVPEDGPDDETPVSETIYPKP